MDFNNLPVVFTHFNSLVSGYLNGTWYDWEFSTESEVFISYFPGGVFNRKVLLFGTNDPRYNITEATLTALDKALMSID